MTEERPAPKTKEELISMLKEQLDKVEDQISNMQDTLEDERQKRKDLTEELEDKQRKVEEIIENQSKTLGDKVNEGLYNTLQTANKIRADAETELRTIAEDNSIVNEKITHKDNKVSEDRKTIILNQKQLAVLEQKKTDLQRKQTALQDKKQQVGKDHDAMKRDFERIEREEAELRGHLQNAKKLRMYLNKQLEGSLKSSVANNLSPIRKTATNQDNFWNS